MSYRLVLTESLAARVDLSGLDVGEPAKEISDRQLVRRMNYRRFHEVPTYVNALVVDDLHYW